MAPAGSNLLRQPTSGSTAVAPHRPSRAYRWRTGTAVIAAVVAVAAAGCGGSGPAPARTDVPEPAVAPALTSTPAGRVVPLPGAPEGLAVDAADRLVAVGVHSPDGVALVDLGTGRRVRMISLPAGPRHLQLAGPRGPLLVPAERANRLYQVSLPAGAILAATPVGRQPHDAAAAGGAIFVSNELADTVSVIRAGRQVAVLPAPVQPGGIAAAADGSVVVVVGVRGRQLQAYTPDGRSLGRSPVGVGPTHIRAGLGGLFYVADTQGDALLVFAVGSNGPHQVGRAATEAGAPYGLAVDTVHQRIYVTLTATNRLESFKISGQGFTPDRSWPTVRQPNDVAVDQTTGQIVVAGTADGVLQLIQP